jgi:hypothetical protein
VSVPAAAAFAVASGFPGAAGWLAFEAAAVVEPEGWTAFAESAGAAAAEAFLATPAWTLTLLGALDDGWIEPVD